MSKMENTDQQAADLWQKYYMLTEEMYRFIKKNEVDMFFQLVEQRGEVQKLLQKLDNKTYHKTAEGKVLISKINPLTLQIRALAQAWLVRMKARNNKVHAYDGMNDLPAGHTYNREF